MASARINHTDPTEQQGVTNGRIVYFEPNEIFGLKEVSGVEYDRNTAYVRDAVGDNVTLRNEDLTMSVDLQVIIPDRTKVYHSGMDSIVSDSQTNKWASIMGGSPIKVERNGQTYYELTTNYTEATYSEVRMDGYSQREMLNIRSISIGFGAYFYPEVTMTMVDVRGFALMMPSEDLFRHNILEEVGMKDTDAKGSFFRSLFHLPYPRFLLTIKGYYGKPVTFNLSVSTFNTSFDSKTGDFIVTIKFIGHMLGVYSDLPFNLLLIAPYIGLDPRNVEITKEGKANTGRYWNREKFRYVDGTYLSGDGTIMTFVEFFQRMTSITGQTSIGYSEIKHDEKDIEILNSYKGSLSLLKSTISEFIANFDKGKKRALTEYAKNGIVVFYNNLLYKNGSCELQINGDAIDKLDAGIKLFLKNTSEYSDRINKLMEPPKIESTEQMLKDMFFCHNISKRKDGEKDVYVLIMNDPLHFSNVGNDVGRNIFGDDETYDKILEMFKENGSKISNTMPYAFIEDWVKYLLKTEEIVQNIIDKNKGETERNRNLLTVTTLGFLPTVRNMFRMMFAHVNAFTESFYALLDGIERDTADGKRKMTNCGLSINETDMVNGSGNDDSLAPFPMVYKPSADNNGMEVYYPGYSDNETLRNIREVKYVDDLIKTIFGVKSSIDDIIKETADNSEELKNMIRDLENRLSEHENDLYAHGYNGDNGGYNYSDVSTSQGLSKELKTNEIIFLIDQIDSSNPYSAAVNRSMQISDSVGLPDKIFPILYIGALRFCLALMYCRDVDYFQKTLKRETEQCTIHIKNVTNGKQYKSFKKEELFNSFKSRIVTTTKGNTTVSKADTSLAGYSLVARLFSKPKDLFSNNGKTMNDKIKFIKEYPVKINKFDSTSSSKSPNLIVTDNSIMRFAHRNDSVNEKLKNGNRSKFKNYRGAVDERTYFGLAYWNHFDKILYGPKYIYQYKSVSKKIPVYTDGGIKKNEFPPCDDTYNIEFNTVKRFNPWLVCAKVGLIKSAKLARYANGSEEYKTIHGVSKDKVYCWPTIGNHHVGWFIEETETTAMVANENGGADKKKIKLCTPVTGDEKRYSLAKNYYKKCCDNYNKNPNDYCKSRFMSTANFELDRTKDKWDVLYELTQAFGFFDYIEQIGDFKYSPDSCSVFEMDGASMVTYSLPELIAIYKYYQKKSNRTAIEKVKNFLDNWGASTYLSDGKVNNLDFVIESYFNDKDGSEWTKANSWTTLPEDIVKNKNTDTKCIYVGNGFDNGALEEIVKYCIKSKKNAARIAFFLERFDFVTIMPYCNMKESKVQVTNTSPTVGIANTSKITLTMTEDKVINYLRQFFNGISLG